MCGIVGAYRLAGQKDWMPAMQTAIATLAKRGPDRQQVEHVGNAYLGHARLSILDLSKAANQPMRDETQRYWIIFNGEIFNYQELAKPLKNAGVNLKTTSDTEVLLQLLIREGISCINRLNGFFAFAFYDAQTHVLTLARDRYGIKPLYIYHDSNALLFASELKALYALGITKTLDKDAVRDYFALNYIPHKTPGC